MHGARTRRTLATVAASALVGIAAPAAEAATRACRPVVNPYAGSRYEGANLSGIRATDVSCATARRVARHAHRKALGMPLPTDGVRRLRWNGWKVTGDLSGAHDRYVATRASRRVRWRF